MKLGYRLVILQSRLKLTHTVAGELSSQYNRGFPNLFERDPNLNLLNGSRLMPQTTYDK